MANVLRMTVNLKQATTISLGLQRSDIEGNGFSQTVRLMPSLKQLSEESPTKSCQNKFEGGHIVYAPMSIGRCSSLSNVDKQVSTIYLDGRIFPTFRSGSNGSRRLAPIFVLFVSVLIEINHALKIVLNKNLQYTYMYLKIFSGNLEVQKFNESSLSGNLTISFRSSTRYLSRPNRGMSCLFRMIICIQTTFSRTGRKPYKRTRSFSRITWSAGTRWFGGWDWRVIVTEQVIQSHSSASSTAR